MAKAAKTATAPPTDGQPVEDHRPAMPGQALSAPPEKTAVQEVRDAKEKKKPKGLSAEQHDAVGADLVLLVSDLTDLRTMIEEAYGKQSTVGSKARALWSFAEQLRAGLNGRYFQEARGLGGKTPYYPPAEEDEPEKGDDSADGT
jgi:hypothetical protein